MYMGRDYWEQSIGLRCEPIPAGPMPRSADRVQANTSCNGFAYKACALSDMSKGAMRKESEAVSQLPQPVKAKTRRAITCMSGRKVAVKPATTGHLSNDRLWLTRT